MRLLRVEEGARVVDCLGAAVWIDTHPQAKPEEVPAWVREAVEGVSPTEWEEAQRNGDGGIRVNRDRLRAWCKLYGVPTLDDLVGRDGRRGVSLRRVHNTYPVHPADAEHVNQCWGEAREAFLSRVHAMRAVGSSHNEIADTLGASLHSVVMALAPQREGVSPAGPDPDLIGGVLIAIADQVLNNPHFVDALAARVAERLRASGSE